MHDASANKNVHVSNASIAACVCLHLKKATRSLLFANHSKHQHRNLIGAVFFRSTILPRKSHIRQEQPYALGSAAKLVLVTRCSCVSRVGCRMASGIASDLSWYQKLHVAKKCASKALSIQIQAVFARIRERGDGG